ncbi:hypothetical protein EGW08_016517 [Elysia chlorotica]|uniref:Uncharacterized protein n=1 Tax=Elysia chlorotica TaxID=188477 RepID=A0A433T2F2_ELYCH|nr:hypothetical protein EGW08_016517 [Elysia chlorotica]
MGMEKDSSRVEAKVFVVVGVIALQVTLDTEAPETETVSFFRSELTEETAQLDKVEVAVVFWLFIFGAVSKANVDGVAADDVEVLPVADEAGFVGVEAKRGGDFGTVENEEREARPADTGVERVGEERAAAEVGDPRDIGDTMVARDRVEGGIVTDTGLTGTLLLSNTGSGLNLLFLLLPVFWLAFFVSLLVMIVLVTTVAAAVFPAELLLLVVLVSLTAVEGDTADSICVRETGAGAAANTVAVLLDLPFLEFSVFLTGDFATGPGGA